jgi:hypothetical protein
MSPLIVEYIGCDICGVKAGEKCITPKDMPRDEHGDRLSSFISKAPYEARLEAHIDMFKRMEKNKDSWSKKFYKELTAESLYLSETEFLAFLESE